jgi:hypothetical protein
MALSIEKKVPIKDTGQARKNSLPRLGVAVAVESLDISNK